MIMIFRCTCVKWYLQAFFKFFQKFDFPDCQGVKRARNYWKSQKITLVMLHISGTIDYMTSFMVRMYKKVISPGRVFIVSKFWFFKAKGKKWPKMTKNSICLSLRFRNQTEYDCDFWYTCVKWLYLQQVYSVFQNFVFLGF